MDSKTYWRKRIAEEQARSDLEAKAISKRLAIEYEKALREIEKEISLFYAKFSKADIKEFINLKNNASAEMVRDLYHDFDSFAKANPQYRHLKGIRENFYKFDNAQYLRAKVAFNLMNMGKEYENIFSNGLKKRVQTAYTKGLQNFGAMGSLDNAQINYILSQKYGNGRNFSSRIWRDTKKLSKVLERELITGITKGEGFDTISNRLLEVMDVSKDVSSRLVRSEMTYVTGQSRLQSYVDMGVEEYDYDATLDNKTSEICSSLDGTRHKIKDARVGENYPPMHPYCRSFASPVIEVDDKGDRAYRDLDGKTKVGEYQTHKEYMKNIEPRKIGDVRTHKQLQGYFKKKYNISITPAVGKLDFKTVKGQLVQLESLMKKYPVGNHLKLIGVKDNGLMCTGTDSVLSGSALYFNPTAYKSKNITALKANYEAAVKAGFSVSGTTYKDIVTHEYGHVLHNYLYKGYLKTGNIRERASYFNERAWESMGLGLSKTMTALQKEAVLESRGVLIKRISGYADTKQAELFAESFLDHVVNGNKANMFSKALSVIIKKELGGK